MELYELTRAELVEAVFGSGERRERRAPLPQDIPDLPGDPDGDDDDEVSLLRIGVDIIAFFFYLSKSLL